MPYVHWVSNAGWVNLWLWIGLIFVFTVFLHVCIFSVQIGEFVASNGSDLCLYYESAMEMSVMMASK